MKGIQWIGGGIMLLCIGACTHDKWADFSDGAVELGFTASTEKPEVTRTLGGTTALTDGANVAVHVWKGTTPSETQKAAYSNTYTVRNNATGKADELVPTGGAMKVESADGYRFYALSTNSAQIAVPGLSSDCRTVSLRNGVDYLMAVNDNGGSGFSISTTSDPIPPGFPASGNSNRIEGQPGRHERIYNRFGVGCRYCGCRQYGQLYRLVRLLVVELLCTVYHDLLACTCHDRRKRSGSCYRWRTAGTPRRTAERGSEGGMITSLLPSPLSFFRCRRLPGVFLCRWILPG
ncbi:hypothetical protein [Parabacteroides faecis]|uniref:hypothetical protein n=1 Tax=Parabacteroides faecis TaxID=1217282 RepID=UPI002166646F|nr:hypothetical protein [Parabacteroides faecis]MCS2892708.1 hypothetical protein [Parabacteroides faecis]